MRGRATPLLFKRYLSTLTLAHTCIIFPPCMIEYCNGIALILSSYQHPIMSVESSWDLVSRFQPRCLSVFAARDSSSPSHNPFDDAVSDVSSHAIGVVFGTDTGSLHYRAYSPGQRLPQRGLSSPSSGSRAAPAPQQPLGSSSSSAIAPVPRSYYPVDLSSLLPGPVTACVQISPLVFLLLVDDQKGNYLGAQLAALQQGHWRVLTSSNKTSHLLPRMACAVFSASTGLVYAAGRTLASLSGTDYHSMQQQQQQQDKDTQLLHMAVRGELAKAAAGKQLVFHAVLPAPGARSGADAMALTANGQVLICAVGNAFYAIAGTEPMASDAVPTPTSQSMQQQQTTTECVKVLVFPQSSQVHPVIAINLHDPTLDPDWSLVFLANGRECAVVDIYYSFSASRVSCSKPRHGTVTCASPILSAASSWPWIAILTSDGLVSIRSSSCMAIALRTVEVGNRPNDFFCLRSLADGFQTWIVAISYSGAGKLLQCHADTTQDLSDRLMRLAIDAFGGSGFPRVELAEAVHASFTATSYVGPEPCQQTRLLLQQYLEAVLGLTDFPSGGKSGWPTDLANEAAEEVHHGALNRNTSGRGMAHSTIISASTPAALLVGSALLCLVCMQVSPFQPGLANRAARACAEKIGVVLEDTTTNNHIPDAARSLCEMVADKMLKESLSLLSLVSGSSPAPIARGPRSTQAAIYTDFVEAAIWLLRACGKHERALDTTYERLQRGHGQPDTSSATRGTWSRIKYESFTATHLSDLWASGIDSGCRLVIECSATRRLLESNPRLGLSVFTAVHPQNESQWRSLRALDEPLARGDQVKLVVELLKSSTPMVPMQNENGGSFEDVALPLESGRALAVTFLESAIGIDTGRPTDDEFDSLPLYAKAKEQIADFHDELSFLLLEGVIAERRDDAVGESNSELGTMYHSKLRKLLRWPLTKIRAERFMETLPPSFLQEKALVLGRLGRHEDALRILYHDLQSMELALEYCDDKVKQDASRARQPHSTMYSEQEPAELHGEVDNAYLPLIRVALDSENKERGVAAAIQVLALRRGAIDRAAALRLLPSNVPVSAVARPFLIPALVDSESQVRRLTVISALLRARYLRLKDQLTEAQLKAQSNIHTVPQLRNLNLGEPLHSTNPFRARTSNPGSSSMPDTMIIKHFFHRYLVIQAKVTNSVGFSSKGSRTLTDVAFVVAESSEDAVQPLMQVPIQRLPPNMTGYAWCVLSATPSRMDGPIAQLTCELRYTIQSAEATGMISSDQFASGGSTFIEELQDLEVHSAHFS